MAGYVTGRETLYRHLYQLQAGEFLIWDKARPELQRKRYFRFYSEEVRQEREHILLEELAEVTNIIFRGVMEEAAGAPIWVPLSGGLDSRLVLCKLKELGYDNLNAFSYGPPGNYEAKAAEFAAEKLGVPWIFVPSKQRESRRFFQSDIRRQYWSFSDGLCSIPFMQDLDILLILFKRGRLGEDAVLINGQSGDFITGGHIPSILMGQEPSLRQFFQAITEKHFSLWSHLKTAGNMGRIEDKVLRLLSLKEEGLVPELMPSHYESWEWQERQCKYVVNGQRIYDFLNLSWELPLWDSAYLHFWKKVPKEHRYAQALYRRYLTQYNYMGLFKGFSPTVWRWPGMSIGVVPLAKAAELFFGRQAKDLLYKYASYFGHYRNHYAGYGLKYFLRNIGKARNVISFSVATWLHENGIPFTLKDTNSALVASWR
jgi:asparagine synthase (glutamine-hydrolysing)